MSRRLGQLADGYYSRARNFGHRRPGVADPCGGCLQPCHRRLLEGRRHTERRRAKKLRDAQRRLHQVQEVRIGRVAAPSGGITDTMTWAAPITFAIDVSRRGDSVTVAGMSVACTPCGGKRSLRRTGRTTRPWLPDALLCATSLVVALGIALALLRPDARRFDVSETPGDPDQTVNLNTARKAVELEAPLAAVFPEHGDRVFAANELFRFMAADPAKRTIVPNVGAIARATAGTESIARTKNLHVFADRLKERTATAERPPCRIPFRS